MGEMHFDTAIVARAAGDPAGRPARSRKKRPGRGRRAAAGETPVHRCAVTGAALPASALIRFGADPHVPAGRRVAAVDLDGRLPGPAVWVAASAAALRRAVQEGLFAAQLGAEGETAEALCGRVEELLVRRVQELLGLARRAGQTVDGRGKCAAYLDRLPGKDLRPPTALLAFAATDGAPAAVGTFFNRLDRLPAAIPVRRLQCLSAAELGRPFARNGLVYLLVRPGGLAETIEAEARRLHGVRALDDEIDRGSRSRVR